MERVSAVTSSSGGGTFPLGKLSWHVWCYKVEEKGNISTPKQHLLPGAGCFPTLCKTLWKFPVLGSTRELKGRLGTGQGNAHGIEMAMKGLSLDTHTSKSKKTNRNVQRKEKKQPTTTEKYWNHWMVEWFGFEGTLNSFCSTSCHGQGHLLPPQVAPSPV